MERRDFLKLGGTAIAAGAVGVTGDRAVEAQGQAAPLFAAPAIENVRIAYVGIGGQGSSHVRNLLRLDGCRITAVCDIRSERTDWATKAVTEKGHPAPAVYNRGPRDFERLCETADVDLVYNATPWEWH